MKLSNILLRKLVVNLVFGIILALFHQKNQTLYLVKYMIWHHGRNHISQKQDVYDDKVILGDDSILNRYTFQYRGEIIRTKVWPWAKLSFLEKIRDLISILTSQTYHCCVIQLYNNGSVGIKPHRDKEMESGTIIASISLGATRTMRFERTGYDNCDISLENGSLLLINPPTNDYWLHSIPWESACKKPRMSLIFRNCNNMLTN